MTENASNKAIVEAAIEDHRTLGGPGLLEAVDEESKEEEKDHAKAQRPSSIRVNRPRGSAPPPESPDPRRCCRARRLEQGARAPHAFAR